MRQRLFDNAASAAVHQIEPIGLGRHNAGAIPAQLGHLRRLAQLRTPDFVVELLSRPYPLSAVRGVGRSQRRAAVKGGRRPARRTLEGCIRTHPRRFTMELAGRPSAGLDAL
jgi:hypothetical protein